MEDQEDRLNPHFQVLEEYLERPGAKCAQDVIRLVPTEESDLENRLSSLHVPFLELTHKSESDQKIQGRWDGKGAVCLGEI
jgi:hypothetical protein